MSTIQNVSFGDIEIGRHFDCGNQAILIQIVDPHEVFPVPKHTFDKVYKFEFLDHINEQDSLGKYCIKRYQAESIVKILQDALKEDRNVVVHCHAGICRSGAIVEVGVMMGFQDTENLRIPNILVKKKLLQVLGWTYSDSIKYSGKVLE